MESKHNKIHEVILDDNSSFDDTDPMSEPEIYKTKPVSKRTYTYQDHVAKWKKVHKRRLKKKLAKRSK